MRDAELWSAEARQDKRDVNRDLLVVDDVDGSEPVGNRQDDVVVGYADGQYEAR